MRITTASMAMLLALPGPAAYAQELDAMLIDCLARTNIGLGYLEPQLETATGDGAPILVIALQALSNSLTYMIAEQSNCSQNFDQFADVISEAERAVAAEVQAVIAAGVEREESYTNIALLPAQACGEAIGEQSIMTAFNGFEENGLPCGWGQ